VQLLKFFILEAALKFINVSFQLFREHCKGELFNICHHPGNDKMNLIHSCCYNYCPVVAEAKRQELQNHFNNSQPTSQDQNLQSQTSAIG